MLSRRQRCLIQFFSDLRGGGEEKTHTHTTGGSLEPRRSPANQTLKALASEKSFKVLLLCRELIETTPPPAPPPVGFPGDNDLTEAEKAAKVNRASFRAKRGHKTIARQMGLIMRAFIYFYFYFLRRRIIKPVNVGHFLLVGPGSLLVGPIPCKMCLPRVGYKVMKSDWPSEGGGAG